MKTMNFLSPRNKNPIMNIGKNQLQYQIDEDFLISNYKDQRLRINQQIVTNIDKLPELDDLLQMQISLDNLPIKSTLIRREISQIKRKDRLQLNNNNPEFGDEFSLQKILQLQKQALSNKNSQVPFQNLFQTFRSPPAQQRILQKPKIVQLQRKHRLNHEVFSENVQWSQFENELDKMSHLLKMRHAIEYKKCQPLPRQNLYQNIYDNLHTDPNEISSKISKHEMSQSEADLRIDEHNKIERGRRELQQKWGGQAYMNYLKQNRKRIPSVMKDPKKD